MVNCLTKWHLGFEMCRLLVGAVDDPSRKWLIWCAVDQGTALSLVYGEAMLKRHGSDLLKSIPVVDKIY